MIIDKNIYRKEKITKDSIQFITKKGENFPLMSVVEISNSGMCNRKCSFCPRSDPNYPDVNEFISEELHYKIFKELSDLKYKGMIIYSGYVEPLLDKKIYKCISEARKLLPDAKIEIITNGDVLNVDRIKKLFNAGLSTLLVSVYDGPEDEKRFFNMCEKAELKKNQYVIRNRYMPETQDFGLNISNRGGNLENSEHKRPALINPLNAKCNYPAYTFFIDYNGDVQMCSHDWAKKFIAGNIKSKKIIDIWLDKKFQVARKKLLRSDRNLNPCNKCDVSGELIGSLHSKEWLKII